MFYLIEVGGGGGLSAESTVSGGMWVYYVTTAVPPPPGGGPARPPERVTGRVIGHRVLCCICMLESESVVSNAFVR